MIVSKKEGVRACVGACVCACVRVCEHTQFFSTSESNVYPPPSARTTTELIIFLVAVNLACTTNLLRFLVLAVTHPQGVIGPELNVSLGAKDT